MFSQLSLVNVISFYTDICIYIYMYILGSYESRVTQQRLCYSSNVLDVYFLADLYDFLSSMDIYVCICIFICISFSFLTTIGQGGNACGRTPPNLL